MPKRPRTKISGRRRNNAKNYLRKRAHALNLLVTNDNEREEERKKKSSFCSKLRNGKCSLQGGSLMLGGSPIQQTFNDRDTSAGALDGATNDQAAAGEEALKIRDDTNKEQTGGFAKNFMPHPSMDGEQAGVQQGVSNTFQQQSADAEYDNKVPKANKCLKEQAGTSGGGRAGRKSLFKKKRTKKRRKKRKGRRTKKRRRKRTKKRKGGRRRRSTKKYFRFSQKPPLIL